ncbi:MAG: TonB-dependent receptor [Prevotella sp.]|nr:TonB-dependent receptor [Prevotella sp.]
MHNNFRWLLTCLLLVSNFCFAQRDTLLSELVVTGTRNAIDQRHLPFTVNVIDRPTLTLGQQPNILPTVMQQVPGVFVTSRSMMGYGVTTGAGDISFRGLSGGAGQMMVLIDGHPQYNGIYGHPISDSYQTMMADRVEVLRGPASVLYGSNAMGGVINIVTRSMHQDGVKTHLNLGAGSWGTVQSEAANQLRYGRFTSTVALQYNRTDNHRPNMGFEQYGGYVKLGYELSSHWQLSADLSLTHWNASNPGTTMKPKLENDQWITRGAASLVADYRYADVSGALSVYDNFGRHKINDGYNPQTESPKTDLFRSKDALAGVSWYQNMRLLPGNTLTVGADYQHIYGRAWYTDRQTGETVTTPRRLMQSAHTHENEVAGYLNVRQDLFSRFTLDVGLRYDHHSTAGGEWVPQAGVVWRPVSTGEAKFMASKGFRNPTTKEMYMYGSANHETLRAERLWNYELSWHQSLRALSYGANIYYIKGDNMIQTVAGKNINTGEIENWGAELEARYRVTESLTLSTNHSFLHMQHKVLSAPEYQGYLGARYARQRWTVIGGVQYIANLYTAVGDNEKKENVCLVNATVNYQLLPSLRLWLRGENLLARHYEFVLGYPMPRATFMAGVNLVLGTK